MSVRTPVGEARSSGVDALRRVLFVALLAVVIGLVPFLSGLVGALILATILRTPYARLSRICPKRVAAFGVAAGAFVLLLVPGAWLVSTIIDEAGAAMRDWNPDAAIAWLSRTPFGNFDLGKELASLGSATLGWISDRAAAFVGGAAHTIFNIVIALFGLYYLLIEGPALWQRVKRLFPTSGKIADLLASRFTEVTNALLLGTALTAALQGALVGIAFALLGLQPAALWGFVTACVAILPVLGSAMVWAPGAALLFFNHRPLAACLLAGFGIVLVSNLDNLVRLVVYRRVSGIHPMLTLVGAFAGVRLFGIIGAFVGPLVLSYFIELIGVYEDTTRIVGVVPPKHSVSRDR